MHDWLPPVRFQSRLWLVYTASENNWEIVTNPGNPGNLLSVHRDAFQFSKFFKFFEFHSLQVARNCQEVVTFKSVMTGLKNQSWLDWTASVISQQSREQRWPGVGARWGFSSTSLVPVVLVIRIGVVGFCRSGYCYSHSSKYGVVTTVRSVPLLVLLQ
jgi:hypothetical protein